VHGEIVPPFPDRPTEGFLHFNVELSPMASQNFEVGRPSPMAVELARIVDRGIRECRALDTEALAIIAGEKVWAITCNIHVVDHGGNLIDCVSLAAIAAMMHYRRPEISVQKNSTIVYNIDEHAAVPLSLHHIPISISFCFIESRDQGEPIIFMDPTDREERITDGSMTFTFNSFRELCAVHKIGGAAISTTEVLRCANVAAARVSELTEILKEEAEKADKIAIDQRRAFLRGRDFADVSSLSAPSAATQNRIEVDLGEMTDFKTLHAPIALRDDPTQEENNAKVTSMAQLLESLEVAAGITETEAAPSASSGFEMSA
jgi:exosome complex RNA-binding protein Rrp42 (RNase PH superfamily)